MDDLVLELGAFQLSLDVPFLFKNIIRKDINILKNLLTVVYKESNI